MNGRRRPADWGLDKAHLQFVLTASAMNIARVLNGLNDETRAETHTTRFSKRAA